MPFLFNLFNRNNHFNNRFNNPNLNHNFNPNFNHFNNGFNQNYNFNNGYNYNPNFNTSFSPNFNNQNFNDGINITPLTQDELQKMQNEMQKNINPEQEIIDTQKDLNNNHDKIVSQSSFNLGNFIQDEQNSALFYNSLSQNLDNRHHKEIVKKISDECFYQVEKFKKLYFEQNKEQYVIKQNPINTSLNTRDSIILAINVEIRSYDKICEILENTKDSKMFSYLEQIIKYKLKRITSLQFILLQKMY